MKPNELTVRIVVQLSYKSANLADALAQTLWDNQRVWARAIGSSVVVAIVDDYDLALIKGMLTHEGLIPESIETPSYIFWHLFRPAATEETGMRCSIVLDGRVETNYSLRFRYQLVAESQTLHVAAIQDVAQSKTLLGRVQIRRRRSSTWTDVESNFVLLGIGDAIRFMYENEEDREELVFAV